jgi:hypothetical protein
MNELVFESFIYDAELRVILRCFDIFVWSYTLQSLLFQQFGVCTCNIVMSCFLVILLIHKVVDVAKTMIHLFVNAKNNVFANECELPCVLQIPVNGTK